MIDLQSFDLNGLQPFDENLRSEADMLEVLGGQDVTYVYNYECKINVGCKA